MPKYRLMLLTAHAIAALGNTGKIALMQGNPLAVNCAEWMALVRYLIPSLKYWVFGDRSVRLEQLAQINPAGWEELLQNTGKLSKLAVQSENREISLGKLAEACQPRQP